MEKDYTKTRDNTESFEEIVIDNHSYFDLKGDAEIPPCGPYFNSINFSATEGPF